MRNLSTTMKNKNDPFPNGLQYRMIPEKESVAVEIWESDEKGDFWELIISLEWFPKQEGIIHAIDMALNQRNNRKEKIALEWFKEYQENN